MDVLADVTVLLALSDPKHKAHQKVSDWFDGLPEGSCLVVCRAAQMGLIRLITSDGAMQGRALTMRQAWAFYGAFIQSANMRFAYEPEGLQTHWLAFCLQFEKATKRVTDAYLAGYAVAAGCSFASLDKGFRDFEGLDWIEI